MRFLRKLCYPDLPFSHTPALKKTHMIVFGSTPNGTFGCTNAVLNRSASAFFLSTASSFSRFLSALAFSLAI